MSIFTSTLNSAAMQQVQREAAPKLAAFRDEIYHNRALSIRIRALFEAREAAGLNAEQQRLAEVITAGSPARGAALGDGDKHRLATINQRLASLYTNFSQNILADGGRPGAGAGQPGRSGRPGPSTSSRRPPPPARQRGLEGQWAIANTARRWTRSQPSRDRRDLREKALALWSSRRRQRRGARQQRQS